MTALEEFTIDMEDGRLAYCPGEFIRGSLLLTLKEPMEMDHMKLQLQGFARFHSNRPVTEPKKPPKDKPYGTASKEELVNLEIILFGNKPEESSSYVPSHPAGSYGYLFEFPLPSNLPASFESPENQVLGTIRYKISAIILRPLKSRLQTIVPIIVNESIDQDPQVHFRPGCEIQVDAGDTCFPSGYLSVEGHLEKGHYVQGENMMITATARNETSRIMNSVYAKLFKRTRYHKKDATKTYEDDIAASFGKLVRPRKFVHWDKLKFPIPMTTPTITRSKVIQVDYFLRVGIFEQFGKEAHIDLPIIIGSEKRDQSTLDESRPKVLLTRSDLSKNYWRVTNVGPRTTIEYIKSVARTSTTKGDAEKVTDADDDVVYGKRVVSPRRGSYPPRGRSRAKPSPEDQSVDELIDDIQQDIDRQKRQLADLGKSPPRIVRSSSRESDSKEKTPTAKSPDGTLELVAQQDGSYKVINHRHPSPTKKSYSDDTKNQNMEPQTSEGEFVPPGGYPYSPSKRSSSLKRDRERRPSDLWGAEPLPKQSSVKPLGNPDYKSPKKGVTMRLPVDEGDLSNVESPRGYSTPNVSVYDDPDGHGYPNRSRSVSPRGKSPRQQGSPRHASRKEERGMNPHSRSPERVRFDDSGAQEALKNLSDSGLPYRSFESPMPENRPNSVTDNPNDPNRRVRSPERSKERKMEAPLTMSSVPQLDTVPLDRSYSDDYGERRSSSTSPTRSKKNHDNRQMTPQQGMEPNSRPMPGYGNPQMQSPSNRSRSMSPKRNASHDGSDPSYNDTPDRHPSFYGAPHGKVHPSDRPGHTPRNFSSPDHADGMATSPSASIGEINPPSRHGDATKHQPGPKNNRSRSTSPGGAKATRPPYKKAEGDERRSFTKDTIVNDVIIRAGRDTRPDKPKSAMKRAQSMRSRSSPPTRERQPRPSSAEGYYHPVQPKPEPYCPVHSPVERITKEEFDRQMQPPNIGNQRTYVIPPRQTPDSDSDDPKDVYHFKGDPIALGLPMSKAPRTQGNTTDSPPGQQYPVESNHPGGGRASYPIENGDEMHPNPEMIQPDKKVTEGKSPLKKATVSIHMSGNYDKTNDDAATEDNTLKGEEIPDENDETPNNVDRKPRRSPQRHPEMKITVTPQVVYLPSVATPYPYEPTRYEMMYGKTPSPDDAKNPNQTNPQRDAKSRTPDDNVFRYERPQPADGTDNGHRSPGFDNKPLRTSSPYGAQDYRGQASPADGRANTSTPIEIKSGAFPYPSKQNQGGTSGQKPLSQNDTPHRSLPPAAGVAPASPTRYMPGKGPQYGSSRADAQNPYGSSSGGIQSPSGGGQCPEYGGSGSDAQNPSGSGRGSHYGGSGAGAQNPSGSRQGPQYGSSGSGNQNSSGSGGGPQYGGSGADSQNPSGSRQVPQYGSSGSGAHSPTSSGQGSQNGGTGGSGASGSHVGTSPKISRIPRPVQSPPQPRYSSTAPVRFFPTSSAQRYSRDGLRYDDFSTWYERLYDRPKSMSGSSRASYTPTKKSYTAIRPTRY